MSPPSAGGPRDHEVVVILPAFHEAERLPAVLPALTRDYCVVVVDDGSRDETSAVARAHGARVVRHPFNLGYGAALQTGYKWALRHGVRFLVQMDADGQHPAEAVPELLDAVRGGTCDLAIGSRFLEETGYDMSPLRAIGRRLFSGLARAAGLEVTDPTSGLQAMSREVVELFASDLYPPDYPDLDVLLLAHRKGFRIGERPVHMTASPRASTLHSGFAPLYYCWRMALALWALSGVPRAEPRG